MTKPNRHKAIREGGPFLVVGWLFGTMRTSTPKTVHAGKAILRSYLPSIEFSRWRDIPGGRSLPAWLDWGRRLRLELGEVELRIPG